MADVAPVHGRAAVLDEEADHSFIEYFQCLRKFWESDIMDIVSTIIPELGRVVRAMMSNHKFSAEETWQAIDVGSSKTD